VARHGHMSVMALLNVDATLGSGFDLDLPNATSTHIHLHKGACPEWLSSFCSMVLSQALSGLIGIKASIPVVIVAWGSLLSDHFPLQLGEGGEWLGTWWACLIFSVLLILEIVSDFFPVVDTVADTVLIFVKPVIAFLVATAPYYDANWIQHITQLSSAVIGLVMALVKASYSVAVSAGTVGLGTPLRSGAETISVTALTYLIISFVLMSFLVAGLCMALVVFVVIHRCRRSRAEARKENKAYMDALHRAQDSLCCEDQAYGLGSGADDSEDSSSSSSSSSA